MVCLRSEDCKESKQNSKGCFNPSTWKSCKTYVKKYRLQDLLEMLENQQGFDGTKVDLAKMSKIKSLYDLAEQDSGIDFEVEIFSVKHSYGASIRDANINYAIEQDSSDEKDEQHFTGKWKKSI